MLSLSHSEPEIATPPLSGTILPGVTRMSLLELGASWVRAGVRRGGEKRMHGVLSDQKGTGKWLSKNCTV